MSQRLLYLGIALAMLIGAWLPEAAAGASSQPSVAAAKRGGAVKSVSRAPSISPGDLPAKSRRPHAERKVDRHDQWSRNRGWRLQGYGTWGQVPLYRRYPHGYYWQPSDTEPRTIVTPARTTARTFGPVIRRDSCSPKVYIRDSESGAYKTYCGSADSLAAATD